MVLIALAMPVLVGTMGLAAETSYWYLRKRAMQNAADAAAIAAATNPANYAAEAKAVAAQLGFQDGKGEITVWVAPSSAAGCDVNCYQVSISDKVPSFFAQVIGYAGNSSTKGLTALSASARATSGPSHAAYPYCILALNGQVADDFTVNGGPKANLNGCSIMANSDATCNGHNLNAAHGDAHGTNSGCGVIERSHVPMASDCPGSSCTIHYSGLASNIPLSTCSSYPHEPIKKNGPALPASNQLSGSKSWSGNVTFCGDVQLTGDTTIDAPSNAVMVIYNGQLDLNGYTLQTTRGSGLTIVFTAPPADYGNQSYLHIPSNSGHGNSTGILDIAAPTSGPWHGVAIYQDPNLTEPAGGGNLDVSAAGNSPAWNISGLVYLPHSNVTFSGAVNKASEGKYCFGMVVGTMLINGTASIFANDTQCQDAGLTLPAGGNRGTLVN